MGAILLLRGRRLSRIGTTGERVAMTASTKNLATPAVFGLPNQLTTLRLALAVVLFVLISFKFYVPALIVFMLAAATDWLDGYLARKYGLITTLGRILDPFAD